MRQSAEALDRLSRPATVISACRNSDSHRSCIGLLIRSSLASLSYISVLSPRVKINYLYKSLQSPSLMASNKASQYRLRLGTADDFEAIDRIGVTAVRRFDSIPELSHLKNVVGLTYDKFQQWLDDGKVFIVEDISKADQPIGFASAFPKDDVLYVNEVVVDLDYQGKGVGGLLMGAIMDWARDRKKNEGKTSKVSLMTYAEVPWNAPWYRRFGFKEVDATSVGPKHVEKMKYDREVRDMNKPGYSRCCMLWEE